MGFEALQVMAALLTLAAPVEELRIPRRAASAVVVASASGAKDCAGNVSLFARQAVLTALPVGYRLNNLTLSNICVPKAQGRLRCTAQLPDVLGGGGHEVLLDCQSERGQIYRPRAHIELQTTTGARSAVVMARGADIKLIVRAGNVTVQAAAVAQESAGLGEPIQVLPASGTKVVRGRVVDARTVEVLL